MSIPANNLKIKALAFLARRDYAYTELQHKLLRYTTDGEQIKQLLTELVEQGLLNEMRFIQNFSRSKSNKYGSQKIRYLLHQKVANPDLIHQFYQPSAAEELANAHQIWQKKFAHHPPANFKEYARQINFLLARGFSLPHARQIVPQPAPVNLTA